MLGIIGTGSWATALAQVLADNKVDLIMWGRSIDEVNDININHKNTKYFNISINPNIKATSNFTTLNECDQILIATPVSSFEEILSKLKQTLTHPVIIINVAKGFYNNESLSSFIKNNLLDKCIEVVSLIGPSHAEEVIERKITIVNSVCIDDDIAKKIQELFANDYFRVYRNNDVTGCEIAAAIKNVMAIASGALTGLGQGDNAKAALMTRGLTEMSRFGLFFNAKKETFLGLNGVGDLIVTCSSLHSRNYQAGLIIGKDDSAKEFLLNNTKTVEGINTAKAVHEIATKNNIDMPICEAVYQVLFNDKKPSELLLGLMKRSLKKEEL